MFAQSIAVASLALLNAVAAMPHDFPRLDVRATCSSITNTTTSTYTIVEGDTIFSIAKKLDRGVCNIARANRMADAGLISVGNVLLIPGEEAGCEKDETTCLLAESTNSTNICVNGGPHVYTVIQNDTLRYVAAKLNLSVDYLAESTETTDVDAPLTEGGSLKLPQCEDSQCVIQPFQFNYGVYKDLAAIYGTTAGQIQAFNPTYNHSDSTTDGPVISLISNCSSTCFGADCSVIS